MSVDFEKLKHAVGRINGDADNDWSLTNALVYCDRVARDRESEIEPQLRHYLQRRSYGKAAELLRNSA